MSSWLNWLAAERSLMTVTRSARLMAAEGVNTDGLGEREAARSAMRREKKQCEVLRKQSSLLEHLSTG